MKPAYKTILIILVLGVVLWLGWFFFIRKTEHPVVLLTQKPTRGYIAQSVTATGKVEPVDTVTVGSQVSGIIKYLYVDFNSRVKKGQLLAELDKSLLQATYDLYLGNLQNAESQLLLATNNYNRQNTLFKTDAISKADYDAAYNAYKSAQATVASVKAQVRSAQKNLSYANIYSPIDGVVLNRNVNKGQTVAASFNTPTLFIIAKDITKMEVDANVDEADIGDVIQGNRATFTVEAFVNDRFDGVVKSIRLHPSVSANVVTYTTIINAPNNDQKLKPGMTANIIIYTKEVNNALLIPVKALSFNPDSALLKDYQLVGQFKKHKAAGRGSAATGKKPNDTTRATRQVAHVWIQQGKKLIRKKIIFGINDNTNVEVLSGLSADDVIVTGIAESADNNAAQSGNATKSPFMPTRQGGGRR